MEQSVVEEKIKQKEIEIVEKIKQIKKNDELGPLMAGKTCFGNRCCIDPVERDSEFSKVCISDAVEYFGRIENLFIEKLKKETLTELGELFILYMDKKEIYQSARD